MRRDAFGDAASRTCSCRGDGSIGDLIVGRPSQLPVAAGTVIAEKYRVEREIGRGGFGVVVSAWHLHLDQRVAIKILLVAEGMGAASFREDAARFRREGRATASLRSEHVVRVHDVDVLDSGHPYIVMEYMEGETLHNALHTRPQMPIGEGVDYALQILEALAEAHAIGIVHRDLKPANVFLTKGPGGQPIVKVLDFGVSKMGPASVTAETIAAGPLTKTGAVIGTVAFMAPEQMLDAKRVDARADLWSVGILLYELLTRQTPFGPQNATSLVTTMLTKPPAPLSSFRKDVPSKLDAVLARCLAKTASDRYASAAKLGLALGPFATARARPSLDRLRRIGKPTGAAAPAGKNVVVGPEVGAKNTRIALTITIVALALTVLLIGLSVGMLLARR